jgi:hypothetical protein
VPCLRCNKRSKGVGFSAQLLLLSLGKRFILVYPQLSPYCVLFGNILRKIANRMPEESSLILIILYSRLGIVTVNATTFGYVGFVL